MRGHVCKRGTSWTAVVELLRESGKRRQRWLSGFPTKRGAEQAMREALGRVETGVDVEPSKLSVGQYLEDVCFQLSASGRRPPPTTGSGPRLHRPTDRRYPAAEVDDADAERPLRGARGVGSAQR